MHTLEALLTAEFIPALSLAFLLGMLRGEILMRKEWIRLIDNPTACMLHKGHFYHAIEADEYARLCIGVRIVEKRGAE